MDQEMSDMENRVVDPALDQQFEQRARQLFNGKGDEPIQVVADAILTAFMIGALDVEEDEDFWVWASYAIDPEYASS